MDSQLYSTNQEKETYKNECEQLKRANEAHLDKIKELEALIAKSKTDLEEAKTQAGPPE